MHNEVHIYGGINMVLKDEVLDKLVGVSVARKSEEKIKGRDFMLMEREFEKLKSFWGKACFLVHLQMNKNPSLKSCGGKLERKVRFTEPKVFGRYIEPFLPEIKRNSFAPSGRHKLLSELEDKLMVYGEDEFIILAKVIYCSGVDRQDWILDTDKVALTIKQIKEIKSAFTWGA